MSPRQATGGQIVLSAAARFGEAGDRDAVAYARSAAAEALARLGFTSDAAVLAAVVERIRTQLGLAGSTGEQASFGRLLDGKLDADELPRVGLRAAELDDAGAVELALATRRAVAKSAGTE